MFLTFLSLLNDFFMKMLLKEVKKQQKTTKTTLFAQIFGEGPLWGSFSSPSGAKKICCFWCYWCYCWLFLLFLVLLLVVFVVFGVVVVVVVLFLLFSCCFARLGGQQAGQQAKQQFFLLISNFFFVDQQNFFFVDQRFLFFKIRPG